MSRAKSWFIGCCLLLAPFSHAENSQVFGHFEVHYSVFPTAFLQPEVAQAYGVVRADNRALLTIAVTDRDAPLGGGLPATVSGTRTDLIQRHELVFQTVQEQTATYFISEFRFADRERWLFDVRVTPEGSTTPLTVQFEKRFEITP